MLLHHHHLSVNQLLLALLLLLLHYFKHFCLLAIASIFSLSNACCSCNILKLLLFQFIIHLNLATSAFARSFSHFSFFSTLNSGDSASELSSKAMIVSKRFSSSLGSPGAIPDASDFSFMLVDENPHVVANRSLVNAESQYGTFVQSLSYFLPHPASLSGSFFGRKRV